MSPPNSNVLAATDLSVSGRPIVTFAAQFAKSTGGQLRLVHVVDMSGEAFHVDKRESQARPPAERTSAQRRGRLEEAASALEAERRRGETFGVQCEADLLEGSVWESVLEHSIRTEAGFIVVGPHRIESTETKRRSMRERRLGSTADRLVRHAECPVWLVPVDAKDETKAPFAKWAVAVDFSVASSEAVRVVKSLATETKGDVALVHIVPPGYQPAHEPRSWQEALHEGTRSEAEKRLLEIAGDMPGLEVSLVVQAATTRLSTELLRQAERQGATVLVTGSHGRSKFGYMVLGSTAERCLRDATMPVLVVRRKWR